MITRGEVNQLMPGMHSVWQFLKQHRVVSIVLGHVVVLTVLGVVLLGNAFGSNVFGAFAQTACANGDQTHVVAPGETLGTIASSYSTTVQNLANYNKLANPNMIYAAERICVPRSTASVPWVGKGMIAPARGQGNVFPYGVCTWWANQRYFQLHGTFVPWTTNANAWQWVARAEDFHWNVSSQPTQGAIMVLQPGVEGAYGLGHVAVVERVLPGGRVVASNMNWGGTSNITDAEFSPGPGVSFITN